MDCGTRDNITLLINSNCILQWCSRITKHNVPMKYLVLIFIGLCVFRFTFPIPEMILGSDYAKDFYQDNDGNYFYSNPDAYHYLQLIKDNRTDELIPFLARYIPPQYIQCIFYMLSTILVFLIAREYTKKYAIWSSLFFFFNSYLFYHTSKYMIDINGILLFCFLCLVYVVIKAKWWVLLSVPILLLVQYTYKLNIPYLIDKFFIKGYATIAEYQNIYVEQHYLLWVWLILIILFIWYNHLEIDYKKGILLIMTTIIGEFALMNERLVIFAIPLFCILGIIVLSKYDKHIIFGIILLVFIIFNFYPVEPFGYYYYPPIMNKEILRCAEHIEQNYQGYWVVTLWDAGIYYKYYTTQNITFFSQPYGDVDYAKAMLSDNETESQGILDYYTHTNPYIVVFNAHIEDKIGTLEYLSNYTYSTDSFIYKAGHDATVNYTISYNDINEVDYCLIINKVYK